MTTQSQHQIESDLVALFPNGGYFVEIGCWDGELISQTAVLERAGWRGICVDPFPKNFEKRSCKLVKKAVSKDGLPREFVSVSIDRRYGGDVSYFSGFKDTIGKNAGIMELITNHCDHKTVIVETTTPNDLFHDQNVPEFIEFLSVDTEGSELEIFESIDFGKYKFGVIDFEHNEDEHSKNAIGKILSNNGYVLYKGLRINDVYINHKLWLDNEYNMWADALGKSSVHNFKEHPMVRRMLGDIDANLFTGLVTTPVPSIIADIDNVGRAKWEPLSGTGLRMLYYAEQVMKLSPKSIVEIGGGVGQFYATLRALGYSGEYYIHDLPAVKMFQDKYLAEVEGIMGLPLSQKKTERPDFCVSFHALGEFDDELKEWYVKNVVKKCKHGFVVWNPHSGASDKIGFKCKVSDEQVSPGAKRLTW